MQCMILFTTSPFAQVLSTQFDILRTDKDVIESVSSIYQEHII